MGVLYKKGFSLLEIMIAVSIIGLLAALSVPAVLNAGERGRARRFAKEIKSAGHAFVQYAFENGDYPGDNTPSEIPGGMNEYLAGFPWTESTVIGGSWDWDYNVFGILAAVSVKSPDWENDRMIDIDKIIDDGNLSSGQFRQRTGGYMYVLEE